MSSQVLVRDVDPSVLNQLKQHAQQNGRSFEAELRIILKEAAARIEAPQRMLAESRKIRALFKGKGFADNTELIREDRER